MEFDSLGIFPYSREPGTEAATLVGALPSETIHSRVEELASLQEAIAFGARSRFIDRRVPVIVDRALGREGSGSGCAWAGRFYGQALEVDGEVLLEGEGLEPGRIVVARITDADACDLRGIVES
jgi:tRNA A37 methylthiotransferase MiaB